MTSDASSTLDRLFHSILDARRSRRSFLKGAAAAGAATAGAGLAGRSAFAQTTTTAAPDTVVQILSIARTAERLAVTFYSNGIKNAAALGITGTDLDGFKAAVIEEQIHELFFAANGGTPLTSTFSFPQGDKTFTDLPTFIATQQTLEGAFDAAFIAAAEEFAQMGQPTLTRYACQIAMIESEHRAFARAFAADKGLPGYDPADNWTYAPKLLASVGQAPGVLQQAGYLSPTATNTYTYSQLDFTSADYSTVYAAVQYKEPFAVTPAPPLAASLPGGGGGNHFFNI